MSAPSVVSALRLGRLGDLVMTLPALRAQAQVARLQLVTGPRYLALMRHALPGALVVGPDELDRLLPADRVLDLHGVPAARRVLARLPVAPGVQRLRTDKQSLARRASLVPGLRRFGGGESWPARHHRLVSADPCPLPTLEARAPARRSTPTLGLVPGAAHPGKRWPSDRFARLAGAWAEATGGASRVFAGPGEEALAQAIVGPACARWPEADEPLLGLLDGLAGCDVVVAGDTGPLHLAGALGVPVVALFGPTPRDAGFWVWPGIALAPELACAPCSLHGGGPCWRGRRACLLDLPVSRVLAAALELR